MNATLHRPAKLVLTCSIALAIPLVQTCAAEDHFPTRVGLLTEYYEIEPSALPPRLREYQQEPDARGLLESVQAMAANGSARLVESCYLCARAGQKAKSKNHVGA